MIKSLNCSELVRIRDSQIGKQKGKELRKRRVGKYLAILILSLNTGKGIRSNFEDILLRPVYFLDLCQNLRPNHKKTTL